MAICGDFSWPFKPIVTWPLTSRKENLGKLQSRLPWLRASLTRLADNFHTNSKEAKGWIKDPEALQVALRALEHREKTVRALSQALDELLG
jgi:hypothetical protein